MDIIFVGANLLVGKQQELLQCGNRQAAERSRDQRVVASEQQTENRDGQRFSLTGFRPLQPFHEQRGGCRWVNEKKKRG